MRESQINCAVLSCVRPDFHTTSATPSYIHYAMPFKSQIKSPLISKQSFSTVSTQRRHSLSQVCTLGYALTDCSRLLADLRRCPSLHQGNDRSRSQPRNASWCWPSDIARFSQMHLVGPAATLVNRSRTTGRLVAPNRPLPNPPPKLQRTSGKIGNSNDMLYHIVRLILNRPGTRGRTETAASR